MEPHCSDHTKRITSVEITQGRQEVKLDQVIEMLSELKTEFKETNKKVSQLDVKVIIISLAFYFGAPQILGLFK